MEASAFPFASKSSAGTDGVSFGKENRGPSAGLQVYNAVMQGMGGHKAWLLAAV
jgi:hypothetical protein